MTPAIAATRLDRIASKTGPPLRLMNDADRETTLAFAALWISAPRSANSPRPRSMHGERPIGLAD